MKNLPLKKIALIVLVTGVFVAGFFYFKPGAATREPATYINPAFAEYISTYSAGLLSSGSPLRIGFTRDVADSAWIGKETSVKLFEFTPAVKGKASWLDRRTLEFKPEERWLSGQRYEVKLLLSKLVQVPSDLKTFVWSFQTIAQNFELAVDNVKPYVKAELTRQKIEGVLTTSDFAPAEVVERSLRASQEGKNLNITWAHTGEGRQHNFIVEDVERKETESKVLLTVNGKELGISRTDEQEIEIPSLSDFKVMSVRVDQASGQHVVVQFSDPLNEKQNLAGLVSLTGISSLEFQIQDNLLRVYPPVRQTGKSTLTIEAGIRNILNYKMKEPATAEVMFEELKPAVRFVGKGTILPGTDGLVLPFEAVNLKMVDVQIVKIFESNIVQFFQVNDMDGNSELRRVGKRIIKQPVSLENSGVVDLGRWNRFTLDLSTLITPEPGAIYQVHLGFKKAYSVYTCSDADQSAENFIEVDTEPDDEKEFSYWDSYQEYYYGDDYDWQERNNPCHSSYYNGEKNISRNVLASDLGLIAKRGGDGSTVVFVTDMKTTKPLSGVTLELYNYQQQLIGSASTGSEGKAIIATRENPFVLVAKSGSQRGYLKLSDGESLSLSNFDVSGERVNKGLKGMIYGERGVWRPGDSLFLTFLLEDKLKLIPAAHPVVFELQNPQGQVVQRLVRSAGENGFYKFATNTEADAPTGTYTARVKVGGTEFTQPVKIEMVKPNRLKINLDFGVDKITAGSSNLSGKLNVKWLHGAPGKNLRAEFEVLLTRGETKFQRYPDYTFEDPSLEFYSEAQPVFDGYTDAEGNATVNTTLQASEYAPGVLNAVFRGKVFEESGNFSTDRFSIPFYPFTSFTGIRLPAGDKARGMLLTDTTHRVDVVTVDADGNPVSRDRVEVTLYKLTWSWWWDNTEANAVYRTFSQAKELSSGTIATRNGKGEWKFKVKYPDWGRYLVRAYDPVSGHSTAKVVYIDWPGWAGRARGGTDAATMLSFSSDKPGYAIGEKASIVIPGSAPGRALVSIENGSRVIESYWVETKQGDTPFSFTVTRDMTPNVFVHVTLVQPHNQTVNDLPIRLYGVIPVSVEDPQTHLEPVIEIPDVLEPGQEVVIRVSEKNKRKMTYTLALVDEGLLDLTRFKTPDPWKRFYAREALGVKTWDVYDQVIGSFGGKIERLLAIGGDMEVMAKEDDAKANRFKAVVKFLGPFTLSGAKNEHRFIMPNYIGSVKTMVVAGYEGAYGSAEKATPVRKPLMVLATLPRVLGPEEKLKLPVTLFATEKNVRNVKVEVKTSGPLQVKQASQNVSMTGSDMTLNFDLEVKSMLGWGKVEVTATSGNYTSKDVIDIQVRNPNPPVTKVQEAMVEAGKTWTVNATPVGMPGTNTATLEVSTLPPINLGQRMKYLLQYPYGCIEQTTSSVFPQLYVNQVKALTDGEQAAIQANIKAGIERLKSFQQRDGGFSYWPGGEDTDSWSTTYAGHFLLEAEQKGYYVPGDMIKRWKKFQRNRAQAWRKSEDAYSSELIQAYRLYALAVAGDPELGAMNRLREQGNLPVTAAWMLAAAYVRAGQPEAARKLIENMPATVKPYQEMAYSYGSDLRDKAIILETLVLLNERTKAFDLLNDISASLSNASYWMSTQTVAWCLKSVGAFASAEKRGELKFSYSYNGKEVTASTDLPVAQVTLPVDGATSGALKIINQSGGVLFARLIGEGIPAQGDEQEESSNLGISVTYLDMNGGVIDPTRLDQGTEFMASVTISNTGVRGAYKNLALTQIFPSGWEINNLRLDEVASRAGGDTPTYQDIRDDRVYTHFDLGGGQRKTFRVLLTASYTGTYYLPAVSCEAMYDRSVYARRKGQVVDVVKPEVQ
ncbi:MAG: alpha-2-macroglobulin family protein [Cyclobacteriaceae bacterium]